jgi:hypothetical protein
MAEDVRSLLTSRARPKVNRRESSLKLNRSADESTLEEGTELPEESAVVAETQVEPPPEPGQLQKLQAELENLPQIGKRLAIHLEQGVRADLLQLCDHQEITPETFFEAAYGLIQDNPKLDCYGGLMTRDWLKKSP